MKYTRRSLGIARFIACLAICLCGFLAIFLAGCEEQSVPTVVATSPNAAAQFSGVRAAVDQARQDNTQAPASLAKQAVDLQLSVAQSGLPAATAEDATAAADLSGLVFAGKLEQAITRAALAERDLATLRTRSEQERTESAQRMREVLAQAEQRVRDAQAEASHEAYLRVVSVFALLGSTITIVGVGCALTGWSRVGVMAIPGGILIGGSGLLFGKPWFLWTLGIGVLLCAVACGIVWAVRVYESRHRAATSVTPLPATLAG